MTKTAPQILIACLLVLTIGLAITQRPRSYYPSLQIEVTEPAQPLAEPLTVNFLFNSHPTLSSCEALTGNIARVLLKSCPQCRVSNITCEGTLNDGQRQRLQSIVPLAVASGRMPNGVVNFTAATPEHALMACQASEVQSAGSSAPVKCFAANTQRPKSAAPSILTPWSLALALFAFAAAWFAGWLIIKYEHLHSHLSHDHVGSGPQKYHSQPTPRIGGLMVMVGLLVAGGVILVGDLPIKHEIGLLLVAGIPAFLGGLVEDLTKQVGVLTRLLLTMLSGAVAVWLLGAALSRLDIPGVDQALQWLPLAVIFTSFAVGGVANAINIIDGYNGLAGGFSVIVLAAIAYVANLVGDGLVFGSALALAGALLGFLVWNWPRGQIFLGDGGAYLLGFLLAYLSVLLSARNPEVSPWFPLLLIIYPVFETLFSIYRKKILRGHSPGKPDGLHLHMLIYKRVVPLEAQFGKPFNKPERNSRVAKYFLLPTLVMALISGVYWQTTIALVLASLSYCVIYVTCYRRIVKWKTIPDGLRKRRAA